MTQTRGESGAAAGPLPLIGLAGWLLAALAFFYAWVLRVSPSVMVEQLMADFNVSGAILGNLSAFYFYAYAALQMPVGIAHDRFGPRRVLTATLLVAGAGCVLFGLAPTVEVAYLGRALIGFGSAFGFVGSMVLAAAWFPARRFALFSGLALGLGIFGGVGGQAPLAYLVEAQGWRASMVMLSGGALVLSILTWLVVRDRPAAAAGDAHPSPPAPIRAEFRRVTRRPQTLLISLYALLIAAPPLAFGGLWGVPYTMQVYGQGRPAAAFTVSFILFGYLIGGPAWGWLSDRWGRRKAPLVIAAAFCAVTLGAALFGPDLTLSQFRALLFLNGFGGAAMSVSYALVREHNAASGTGAALGLVNMSAVAGGAIFQPVVGFLLDRYWDGTLVAGARVYGAEAYLDAFLILPALYGGAVLVGLLTRETWCRPMGVP